MKRLQNTIAESRWSLPVTAVYSLLVCLACGAVEQQLWMQVAALALSALMMVELNNANTLIRIYSRMVSCSFLVLTCMATFLFPSLAGGLTQLCFIVFYVCLFQAYQDKTATGWTFYAFFALGIASTMFVQILFYVPVLWLLLLTKILAGSWRTFWASVLGLAVPYWFLGGYDVYTGQAPSFLDHFTAIARFQPLFDYSHVTEHQLVTFAFVAVLCLTGTIHYLRHSYMDKIRTRMLYELMMVVNLATVVFLVLQPRHYDFLLRILIINTAPFIGHFLALTHTKWTNMAFLLFTVLTLLLTAYNLWMPSLLF